MNTIELARQCGMLVLLEGRIGQQEYRSVSGSLDSLERFANALRAIDATSRNHPLQLRRCKPR
jgi:hypothetical protein